MAQTTPDPSNSIFAPGATAIVFSPSASTVIWATPERAPREETDSRGGHPRLGETCDAVAAECIVTEAAVHCHHRPVAPRRHGLICPFSSGERGECASGNGFPGLWKPRE